jgi:transcriptional regulator with XRE-family HTH domain
MNQYKPIPPKKIKQMEKLFSKGLSISEIARRMKMAASSIYTYTRAKQRGFSSVFDYQTYLAHKKGFKTNHEYKMYLANRKKSIKSGSKKKLKLSSNYIENIALRKGFSSKSEYEYFLMKRRKNQLLNKELRSLLRIRLKELQKKPGWLAEQLGVRKTAVYDYMSGRTKPAYRLQKKFFELLGLPYQTIEDFKKDLEKAGKSKNANSTHLISR